MNKTNIEWCDMTWNPITGCLHDCSYCYARNQARRFAGCYDPASGENIKQNEEGVISLEHVGRVFYKTKKGKIIKAPYPYGFTPTFHSYRLDEPQGVTAPQNVFVGSMADVFGKWVPFNWIEKVFRACESAPQHKYLFLTKNPERYTELAGKRTLPAQHIYGTTITGDGDIGKVDELPITWHTFLSIEPLVSELPSLLTETQFFKHINWVIIGAETGRSKNKVIPKQEWIKSIVDDCRAVGIPVFLKNNLAEIWGEPLIQEYPWAVSE